MRKLKQVSIYDSQWINFPGCDVRVDNAGALWVYPDGEVGRDAIGIYAPGKWHHVRFEYEE